MSTERDAAISAARTRVVTGTDPVLHADSVGREPGGLARITVRRQVEWADTDAAGHHHFGAPLLWVEQAESLLYDRLGIVDFIAASIPRVHFDIDYFNRLKYRDTFELTLAVDQLGRSSLTYRFEITSSGGTVARGKLVVVLTDRLDRRASPWPQGVRTILGEAGDQSQ